VLTVHHHENGEISHVDVDKHIADNRLPPPTPAMLEYLSPEREPSLQTRPE
jgi:biofilm PGA synthesis protein PgaD